MLRITKVDEDCSAVTLRLEGQIVSAWAGELGLECRRSFAQHRRVHLDFAHVTFVDEHGCKLLRSLAGDQLDIVNCPALIQSVLDDGP